MKSPTDQPLYKYSLPLSFYLSKMAVIALALPLAFLYRDDRVILLVIIVFSLFVLMNTNYYILEVYEDKFNIIRPNFFSKFFAKGDTYYFDELSGFEYTKEDSIQDDRPSSTNGELALAVALSIFLRPRRYGSGSSLFWIGRSYNYNPASVKFDNKVNAVTEEITYTFKNANNDLKKGLEILAERMNKKAEISKNNHKNN
ncbi:MAG: hypothetical protein JWP12_658 [Bacteroidetes bacterium]|nr:hypothetical protein [Bacteroidota bacterium]